MPTTPAQPATPAWSDTELSQNPHANQDKAGKVRAMFSAIAPSYDLNNRVHSLWRDQAWRRYAVRAAQVKPGDVVLDIACGTGDLTEAFANSPAREVRGIDFTPAMLEVAKEKSARRPEAQRGKISYSQGDATDLRDVADASADVVSIAFGIRNVGTPEKALAEFARVLRPGGRLIVLEFDRPRMPPMSWFYDLYCGWIMPRTATLISGDKSGAYKYLPKSVGAFMTRDAMKGAMERVGFGDVTAKALTFGICVCYRGIRRA